MSDSPSPSEPLGLARLVDVYEHKLQEKSLRPSTLRTYRSQWSSLLDYFGPGTDVARISDDQLERFYDHRLRSGRASTTTAQHDCEALVRMLQFAASIGWFDGELPQLPRRRQETTRREAAYPSAEEFGFRLGTLVEAVDRDRVLAVYLFMAPVRDLGRIRAQDVGVDRLILNDSRGRQRTVPLFDATRALLARSVARGVPQPFPVAAVESSVRRFREANGIRFGASRLVKALAPELVADGIPEPEVLWLTRGAWFRGAREPGDFERIRSAMQRIQGRIESSRGRAQADDPERAASGGEQSPGGYEPDLPSSDTERAEREASSADHPGRH